MPKQKKASNKKGGKLSRSESLHSLTDSSTSDFKLPHTSQITDDQRCENEISIPTSDSSFLLSEQDMNKPPPPLHLLIKDCKNIIHFVQKDANSILSPAAEMALKRIQINLTLLEEQERTMIQEKITLEVENASSQEKSQQLQTLLHATTQQLPNPEDMNAIAKTLTHLNQQINSNNAEIQSMKELVYEQLAAQETLKQEISKIQQDNIKAPQHITDEDFPPLSSTIKKTHTKSTTNMNSQINKNKEEENTPPHRRTIVITQIQSNSRRLSGKELRNLLNSKHPAYPSGFIENILTRRNHVEIECTTDKAKALLIGDLQLNKDLNQILNFTTKSIQMQKMILLGVSNNITEDQIMTAIIAKFKAVPEEIIFTRNTKGNRLNTLNWQLILPLPLAKAIVEDGGLLVGYDVYRLRPYTQVIRCRNCQALGHHTSKCRSPSNCESCGDSHETPDNCINTPHCINCELSNQHKNTTFSEAHKASDPSCETYRLAYTLERNKLENLFNLFEKDIPFPPSNAHPATSPSIPPFETQDCNYFFPGPWQEIFQQNNRMPLLDTPVPPFHQAYYNNQLSTGRRF